jgi:hypothetical protein
MTMQWTVTVTAEDDEGHDSIEIILPSTRIPLLQIKHDEIYYAVEMFTTTKQVSETDPGQHQSRNNSVKNRALL